MTERDKGRREPKWVKKIEEKEEVMIEEEIITKEEEREGIITTEEEGDHRIEDQVVVATAEGDLNDGTVLGPHTVSGVWMGGGVERQM